jgi:hypothetical protein
VSGITICTILFASLLLLVLLGKDAAIGPVAAIMIGSVRLLRGVHRRR